jgi:hypothetical protein
MSQMSSSLFILQTICVPLQKTVASAAAFCFSMHDGYFWPYPISNHRSPLLIFVLIRIKLEAPQLIVSNTPITTSFTFTATPLSKSAHRLSAWDCSENDRGRSKLPRILQFAINTAPSLLTKSSGYRI